MPHQLKKGQRVKFYRTHDKQNVMTGTIASITKGSDLVEVKTDKTKDNVSRIEAAHASDVTIVEDSEYAAAAASAEEEEESDGGEEEKEEGEAK